MRALIRIAAVLLSLGWPTLAAAASADWPKSLTLGTASPGGVYYVYGEAVAQILTEKLGIPVNPLPTQGPVHNVKLVDAGGAQLGMITMGVGLQGWNGEGDWTSGQRYRKMRALFPMYDTPFQIVVLRSSGISSLAQLKDRRIGAGPRAGTGGTYVPEIMKVLGIPVQVAYGSFADLTTELVAGRYDAIVTLAGAPMPAIQNAEAQQPVTFIGPSAEEMAVIRKAMPEFSPSTIAARTYRYLSEDHATLGVYNFAIGRAELPDDLVYRLVKAVHDNQDRLIKAHDTGKETLPANVVKNTFLPFHPGAARYYREAGVKIADSLISAK
jgi:TRAP transporter TAXI family solute receptor